MNFKKARKYILTRLEEGLPHELFHYHGLRHTLDVEREVMEFAAAEKISGDELVLLKTAALYHDSGFLVQYKNNEEMACVLAKEFLPEFDYSQEQIESICKMIMATRIPQEPQNLSERILCDADLEYLGTDRFCSLSNALREELADQDIYFSEKEWLKLEIDFMEKHKFFTNSAARSRNDLKMKHLSELKKALEKLGG